MTLICFTFVDRSSVLPPRQHRESACVCGTENVSGRKGPVGGGNNFFRRQTPHHPEVPLFRRSSPTSHPASHRDVLCREADVRQHVLRIGVGVGVAHVELEEGAAVVVLGKLTTAGNADGRLGVANCQAVVRHLAGYVLARSPGVDLFRETISISTASRKVLVQDEMVEVGI